MFSKKLNGAYAIWNISWQTYGRCRAQQVYGLDSPPTILNSYLMLLVKQDTIQQLFHERAFNQSKIISYPTSASGSSYFIFA